MKTKTSPDSQWFYRINLLASGTYPWVPCKEDEAKAIQRQGFITLPSGVRFPAVATSLEQMDGLA